MDSAVPQKILRLASDDKGFTPYVAYCQPGIAHREWGHTDMAEYLYNLPRLGVHTVYTPNTSQSNAVIGGKSLLNKVTSIDGLTFYYDPDVALDGIGMLQPGEACVLLTAGCTTNVISTPKGIIVFHGSRESWVDRSLVEHDMKSRENPTVLHSAVKYMHMRLGTQPNRATFRTLFGIDPRDFPHPVDHPEHSTYNSKLPIYLGHRLSGHPTVLEVEETNHLCLQNVATGWAHALGFIDKGSHCQLPAHGTGEYVTTASSEGRAGKRNLVVVYVPVIEDN